MIQAANLHVALAFGRTSFFEQPCRLNRSNMACVPDPHGRRTEWCTRRRDPGLGIELDDRALEDATIALVERAREGGSSMRFEGRRVVVTGASRGIGRGIVDAFLDEGATVLATDVLDDGLEALIATHPGGPPRDRTSPTCVRSTRARGVVAAAIDALGGLDVLVNNAGAPARRSGARRHGGEFDATFAVNVRAPMLTMQEACRHWIDRGCARARS